MRATRITYVGELGWELYVPTEFAVGVYEDLVAAGADLGLADAGYSAINSLRLDKGYRAFGSDLTPDHTPLEAGLRFTCKLATPIDFVGRAALEAAIAVGPRQRLVSLRVGDPEAMVWGGELVLHDGEPAGQVTSAGWSATCGAAVGLAYVWRRDRGPIGRDDLARGTWEVMVGDVVAPLEVQTGAFYDPKSETGPHLNTGARRVPRPGGPCVDRLLGRAPPVPRHCTGVCQGALRVVQRAREAVRCTSTGRN